MSSTLGAPAPAGVPWRAASATVVSVVVVAVCLTWAYLSMRAVMGVGGACADGGPYVSAQPCPDGAILIGPAIPVMMITCFVGTATASAVGAPNLLVPMWGVLFGTLGWNFLEFAVKGPDLVWGWLVCGVLFWAMAAPAFYWMATQLRPLVAKARSSRTWLWTPAYGVLGAVGLFLGWWSYLAIAS
jgi:hypothetical protein